MKKNKNNKNPRPVLSSKNQVHRTGLNTSAFTLVELIVVITILAILGTIAFISLQGYSKSSRDSVRISDVSNMKTALELFHLNSGKYPLPDDYGTFTYSGNDLFYQGYFGDNVVQNISRNMTEVPTDPLTERKYIYSVANNKNEFEILVLLEGDGVALNAILQTNAASIKVTPKITGNYNGLFVKTSTHIVPLPSIINTEATTGTLIMTQSIIESMVTNLGDNVPDYGNIVSNSGALTGLVLSVYTGSITSESTNTEKETVILQIQNAYTGLSLSTEYLYKTILEATTTEELVLLTDTIILNESITFVADGACGTDNGLNFRATIPTNLCTDGTPSTLIDNGIGSTYDWSCNAADGGETVSCNANHLDLLNVVANCGTVIGEVGYTTADGTDSGLVCTDDILVCNGTTGSGYTISACNAGLTVVAIAYNDANSYGELYQWGNNAGNSITPTSTGQVLVTATGSTYSSGTFIYSSPDWNTTQNDDLWGDTTNTDEARIGPCLTGYHVPSNAEWVGIHTAGGWGTNGLNMSNALKIPMAGGRNYSSAALNYQGSNGYYWSSSPSGTDGYFMYFRSTIINPSHYYYRANGFSVRCFKN